MVGCPFCKLDDSIYYNHIIEETNNFKVIPGVGALVPGYIIILPKRHTYSILTLDDELIDEYNSLIEKYRSLFKSIYGKHPIVFEHGTPDPNGLCASCVIHAHAHLINHNYHNEREIIRNLNFKRIKNLKDINNKNYIYYKNQDGKDYITYDFKPISQIMRIYIAEDLKVKDQYNWRIYPFEDNIKKTINDLNKKI